MISSSDRNPPVEFTVNIKFTSSLGVLGLVLALVLVVVLVNDSLGELMMSVVTCVLTPIVSDILLSIADKNASPDSSSVDSPAKL